MCSCFSEPRMTTLLPTVVTSLYLFRLNPPSAVENENLSHFLLQSTLPDISHYCELVLLFFRNDDPFFSSGRTESELNNATWRPPRPYSGGYYGPAQHAISRRGICVQHSYVGILDNVRVVYRRESNFREYECVLYSLVAPTGISFTKLDDNLDICAAIYPTSA